MDNETVKLVKFRKSTNKNKKYDAILSDGSVVPFGSINHEHYRDITPLKLYSNFDHLDQNRKINFRKRFKDLYLANKNNLHSPIYWSWNYLW